MSDDLADLQDSLGTGTEDGSTTDLESKFQDLTKIVVQLAKKLDALDAAKQPDEDDDDEKKKKKYPFPEKEELSKTIEDLETKVKEHESENKELAETVEKYKGKEKEELVNELLDKETKAGLINDDTRKDLAAKYTKMPTKALDLMIEKTDTMDFSKAKKDALKGTEAGTKEGKDFSKKKEALEATISDFSKAGLPTKELKKEVKELKGE